MVARISALGGGGSEERHQLDTGGLRGAPHRGRGGAGCGHGIRLGTDGSVASCGRRSRAVLRLNQGGPVLFGCSRSEEHTSELQSRLHLVCRLLLEKKKKLKT